MCTRRVQFFEPLDDDASPATAHLAVQWNVDAQHDLDRLLAALPRKQRESNVQTRLRGRPVAETETLTGLTEPVVEVSVHRRLKALAAKIKREIHED